MFHCEPPEVFLKTLLFLFVVAIVPAAIVGNCLRSKKKSKKLIVTPSSKSKELSFKEEDKTQKRSEKEISDAHFKVDVKKSEKKYDEFDDDEENPLAKLPVRPRKPPQKPLPSAITPTTPPKTTVVTAKMGPKMESEKPLFPTNDNGAPKSCYLNLG
ncbi:unnamed protein product [Caenorhabditis brenneri]